jgi:CHAP domain
MPRTCRRLIEAAVIAATTLLMLTSASGAASSLSVLTPTSSELRPGSAMLVQASVPVDAWCGITLERLGAPSRASGWRKARSGLAQFVWHVPSDVAAGRWQATVACAHSRPRSARAAVRLHRSVLLYAPRRAGLNRGAAATRIRTFYPLFGAQPLSGKGGGSYPPYGALLIPGAAWLDGHGVNVYSDGADGGTGYYQCVELVNRLITTLHWSPSIYGNANQLYANASSAYFVKHPNGSGYVPVPGDIVVWGGGYGGYGHVQIVNANNGGSLTVVEQNASPSGYDVDSISASGNIAPTSYGYYVEGFLHPKADTIGQSTPAPTAPTSPTPTVPAGTHAETAGGLTHTWSDYATGGGAEGPSITAGQTVAVTCKVTGLAVADGDTWWYLIASSPWNGAYYASADAFYNNGQTSGPLKGTPFVDAGVPPCPGQSQPTSPEPSPPTTGTPPATPAPTPTPSAPATYAETTGGVTHTWSDYGDAGGTQGPSIPANDTVQISCKVTGFRVQDGNTWWYRIASSPWNNAYYASADAFYNNGQTSGSLVGTPFMDVNVPNC